MRARQRRSGALGRMEASELGLCHPSGGVIVLRCGPRQSVAVRRRGAAMTHQVMEWLAEGLPLSLLMDLSDVQALDSAAILATEADSRDWISAQFLDVA